MAGESVYTELLGDVEAMLKVSGKYWGQGLGTFLESNCSRDSGFKSVFRRVLTGLGLSALNILRLQYMCNSRSRQRSSGASGYLLGSWLQNFYSPTVFAGQ